MLGFSLEDKLAAVQRQVDEIKTISEIYPQARCVDNHWLAPELNPADCNEIEVNVVPLSEYAIDLATLTKGPGFRVKLAIYRLVGNTRVYPCSNHYTRKTRDLEKLMSYFEGSRPELYSALLSELQKLAP